MLLMTSPGKSPNAAAGMPITGGGTGPGAGGTAGLRMSPVVAGTIPKLGDAGLRVNDGLAAIASVAPSSSTGSATSATRNACARQLLRNLERVVMVRLPLLCFKMRPQQAHRIARPIPDEVEGPTDTRGGARRFTSAHPHKRTVTTGSSATRPPDIVSPHQRQENHSSDRFQPVNEFRTVPP